MAERLSASLQENLLTLLCFNKDAAKIIAGAVEAVYFDPLYRDVATRAIDYLKQYKEPAGEHIADLFEDVLSGKDKKRSNFFGGLLRTLHQNQGSVNADYAIDNLTKFLRLQKMRSAIQEAAELLQDETTAVASLDEATEIMRASTEQQAKLFDPGTRLSDAKRTLAFLEDDDEVFPTGIRELDLRSLGPVRKGLHVFIGLAKRGKSWWLINLGRRAAQAGKKVLHITLEMSEKKVSQRYMQTFFAASKRATNGERKGFETDELGRVTGVTDEKIRAAFSFDDPKAARILKQRITKFQTLLNNIIVKEFPTRQLTYAQLVAYIDGLEHSEKFIPDLIILDYVDLMKVSIKDFRLSLGDLMGQVRGLAVQRNLAIATVTQSNREGLDRKEVGEGNVAEDWSKVAIADVVMTYSQTKAEKQHGIARITVTNARNEMDGLQILISQSYATGQFCRASALMTGEWLRQGGMLDRLPSA